MKVSQKLENACRVLVQLAQGYDGHRVVRVEDLARKEGLSANFLLQILNDLRRAGLVASRRGKLGGYILARPATEITLRDIVEAVDGAPLEVELNGTGEAAGRVARTWKEIATRFEATLSAITLASMASPGEVDGMFWI
ncbi:MAG: RrF2 family transcriptional regulator [Verrucomicrobiales bacterium]